MTDVRDEVDAVCRFNAAMDTFDTMLILGLGLLLCLTIIGSMRYIAYTTRFIRSLDDAAGGKLAEMLYPHDVVLRRALQKVFDGAKNSPGSKYKLVRWVMGDRR